MIGQHLRVLWHGHGQHGGLLEALHRQLHGEILEFRRLLYLVRIEHLNLYGLLGVARLVTGHRDWQYECLRLGYIGGGGALLRLVLECGGAIEGPQELNAAIGARDETDHLAIE